MKKKWIIYVLTVFVLSVAGLGVAKIADRSAAPEFEIVHSIKNSFDNYQSADISVVVNVKGYDDNEMMEKVRAYYELNGAVDELKIKLYDSRSDFEKNVVAAEAHFSK